MIFSIRFLLLFVVLSGCTSSISYTEVATLTYKYFRGAEDIPITDEFIADQDFSFIKVTQGRNSSAIFVLSSVNEDGSLRWVSSSMEVLVTYDGKIIKTENLYQDFRIINFDYSFFSNPSNVFVSNFIMDKVFIDTLSVINLNKGQIVENVFIDSLNWEFENTYELNDNKDIIKSKQYIFPNQKPIVIEFFLKY